ncbi:MAG: leucine-rich repeat domain-containing protein [Proteobacteria bacterium]|nr:leucine-rich repeat domain-containing protein [Pseudomonadota bacterium]
MKRIVTPIILPSLLPTLCFALLFLGLTTTEVHAQQKLAPTEHCSNHPQAIASFADAVLEQAVRDALSIGPQDALNCSRLAGLTTLNASGPGPQRTVSGSPAWPDPDHVFQNLAGMQNLTGLTRLTLNNRGITDISALKGLTKLTALNLHTNWISDLTALSEMTQLTSLFLSENPLGDIGPLSELTELTVLRLHRHGDFIGGQVARNFMGARGLLFTNAITDISPLAKLTKLVDLNIHTQEVSDLRPLSGLTSLIELRLAGNLFTDLSPLAGLTTLENLELTGNSITDLSALRGLGNLTRLDLRYNPDLGDIQPLLDNNGIGAGDIVELRFTRVSCTDQALLVARGVEVRTELFSSCT